ncbi:hypothetical protein QZH41_010937 [Actinostola sp. cb2023]|nr:hypothetical protein QZH41_010937 [Actinostola sp. cb2023]
MPPKSLKRKIDTSCEEDVESKRLAVSVSCILHVSGIQHGDFIPLSNVKGSATDKLVQLHNIRDRRLIEPQDSPNRMEDVCNQIPDSLVGADLKAIGYHRGCYQKFTKNQDRLKISVTSNDRASITRSPRKSSSASDLRLFPATCIFCEKLEFKLQGKTERCVMFAVFKDNTGATREPTWKQIEPRALALGNNRLHRMVQDQDLFAREARFHPSCRKDFNLKYINYLRDTAKAKNRSATDTEQDRKASAHLKAFNIVLDFIQDSVIEQKEVVQLASLRILYIQELERNGFPNPEYRSEKLRARLENHDIRELIDFAKVNPGDKGCITYNLVYSASISVADAVVYAYKLGSKDKYEDVALLLRNLIQQAFKQSKSLPWPPSADELEVNSTDEILPPDLVRFLNYVVSGDENERKCEKTRRIVLSIGQDICRAVTNGEWKMPKHILLCTTLRHLYRSKQLTTILSRLGHCETYDFGLELETALAKALDEVSTSLTPQIITGEGNNVFHFEWDNMNKITTNIHGSNVVNSAGGIMIQEVKPGFDAKNDRTLPLYKRSTTRALKVDTPETLAPVHIYSRVGPKLPERAMFTMPTVNSEVYLKSVKEYQVWMLARVVGSSGVKQLVPGFGGFVSATGTKPVRKSTIEYFTPINQPFTEYSVIKELLKRSENATREVGQEYVLNTFDLGGCMKALPLIWKFPDEYKKHVVLPGPFHTGMNYMGMVTGNKCRGSGYSEILIEAGLVTSGCLTSVLKGKAYAKALFCLKTVSEAMERFLFERFVEEEEVEVNNPAALLNLVQTCNRETLDLALQDPSTITILEKYVAYQEQVRAGHLGKTATFWLSIIDHTCLILMLQYSVKTNNFALFHKCNGDMANLFFAYDGPNYSRFLVWLDLFLTNIDKSHPGAKELLKKGGIAVARSFIPGALSAVDKTMEETFMKFAKWICRAVLYVRRIPAMVPYKYTSTRAQYFEKMLETCGLVDDPDCPKAGKHRELEKAEIKKSEEAVQRTMSAIRNFTNPFSLVDKDHLYSIASGAPVPPEAEMDVLRAEAVGKEAKETFIRERFVNGSSEALFYEPIKRQKLKTMEASNKVVKLTASQGKVIQYREQSDLAFMLLIKSQHIDEPLNLDELMMYSLTPVPHSLGTPDGFFNKTNKAAMLHFLTEDVVEDVPYPKDKTLFIQDGNALFHALTNLPPTFGAICLQVLDQMVAKTDFVFSTDSYHADSIKSQERLRRGFSQRYIVEGPATRKPADFKLFLANENNKTQLCKLLLRVWGSKAAASRLDKCGKAVVVVEGKAYQLDSSNGDVTAHEIHELTSNQEETDTRVVLYLKYAAKLGYKSAVVRTPDTDIFLILLHHASSLAINIYLDTGTGKHRKIVNVSELAESKGADYCTTMLGLYVFTGEDVTSAFKGKGKIGPLKKLQNHPKYHVAFRKLGDEWSVEDETIDEIEEFTCLMYGYAREKSLNTVRSIMLKKMVGEDEQMTTKSKVDLSRLPPCRDNLVPHIGRVNYRLANYKCADKAIFWRPNPYDPGQGWQKTEEGLLEPVWSCGPILPLSLIDLLEKTAEDVDEEGDEQDVDYDEFFSDDD